MFTGWCKRGADGHTIHVSTTQSSLVVTEETRALLIVLIVL